MSDIIPGLIEATEVSPLEERRADRPYELRVMGFDLSITSTGVARVDGSTFRIKTRQKDGPRRLTQIRDVLSIEVAEQRPHLVVIEDLPTKMHPRSLKPVAALHGVVQALLVDADVPWAYVAPLTLKKYACDNGRADKAGMAAAAFLADGAAFDDDDGGDRVDAWWLRAAGLDWCGLPQFAMPQAQRDVLSKAEWPDTYAQRYVMGAAA